MRSVKLEVDGNPSDLERVIQGLISQIPSNIITLSLLNVISFYFESKENNTSISIFFRRYWICHLYNW